MLTLLTTLFAEKSSGTCVAHPCPETHARGFGPFELSHDRVDALRNRFVESVGRAVQTLDPDFQGARPVARDHLVRLAVEVARAIGGDIPMVRADRSFQPRSDHAYPLVGFYPRRLLHHRITRDRRVFQPQRLSVDLPPLPCFRPQLRHDRPDGFYVDRAPIAAGHPEAPVTGLA